MRVTVRDNKLAKSWSVLITKPNPLQGGRIMPYIAAELYGPDAEKWAKRLADEMRKEMGE